jgi:hypothetical protein
VFADEDGTGAELWAMAQLATPMAVRVAATLRVADHIAAGLSTAPKLAEAVDADPDALERLLRFLARRGLWTRDETGRYELTRLGQALRADHPAGMRDWLDMDDVGRAELSFFNLLHTVRTGESAFQEQFGVSFWDDLAARPERGAAFDAMLGADAVERSPFIVKGHDWGSLGHVVDVGGGAGALLIALLKEYPELRGTLFDLPETAESARKALKEAALDHRSEVVSGSFFDDALPPGAGGYLLSFILHDWADGPAREILRRCAEAAGAGGSVFVVERLGRDGAPHTGMDLRMLVYYGGKERGMADFEALAADAGLRVAATHPAGPLMIFELVAG